MVRSVKRCESISKSLIIIFINHFIRKGIRFKIYRIFILVLIRLKKRFKQSFTSILKTVLNTISPLIQLKPKFSSGIIYMIPDYPKYNKAISLGLNFFVKAVLNRREYEFYYRLLYEFRDILKNKGLTLKYKKEFHKLALMNRHLLFKFNRR